ncbi:hypothetical protein PC0005_03730 [Streptococcus pneumoniae]|nr:hypothetical protein PC0005_03730 [Streptococcus pneumoniae]
MVSTIDDSLRQSSQNEIPFRGVRNLLEDREFCLVSKLFIKGLNVGKQEGIGFFQGMNIVLFQFDRQARL